MLRFAGLVCQEKNPGNLLMKFILSLWLFLTVSIAHAQNRFSLEQKEIGMSIYVPWLNNIRYFDYYYKKPEALTGFNGLGAGVFYRVNAFKYSLNASLIQIQLAPWGNYAAGTTREPIVKTMGIDAMVHYAPIDHLQLVGGINYYNLHFRQPLNYEKIVLKESDASLGLTFGIEGRLADPVNFGLFYRPAIIGLDNRFRSYSISFELRADLAFWKSPRKARPFRTTPPRVIPTTTTPGGRRVPLKRSGPPKSPRPTKEQSEKNLPLRVIVPQS
ncbi:hypothetical protein EV199_4353 [Pseudobacter ginsenosidimutans]|uniref:Outer membrane protein with beta-barrel domain n=2 Tax=Pseudobacter ginsenosidimutans TaxID=661488 RepID=A0A4Q7MU74_9BACT|nr:hypothetical protein EV199_4353 [Pseudobacter ginsenosidimutans]